MIGTLPALYFIETWGRRKVRSRAKFVRIPSNMNLVDAPRCIRTSSLCTHCVFCIPSTSSLYLESYLQVALVGHFCLAATGTPASELTSRNRSAGGVVIAFAVLQVFIFGTTWGPTPWVYLGESFPLRVRPKSIALGSATSEYHPYAFRNVRCTDGLRAPRLVLELYVVLLLPTHCSQVRPLTPPSLSYTRSRRLNVFFWGADRIGPLIMLIFSSMLIFGLFYVYFFIPETKGISLEEVINPYHLTLFHHMFIAVHRSTSCTGLVFLLGAR